MITDAHCCTLGSQLHFAKHPEAIHSRGPCACT